MTVHIELVGGLRLGQNGRWIHDDHLTRHARLASAYFVLERGRRIPREELADLLWEERLPPSWKSALRGVVGRVRAMLARGGLTQVLTTGPGWHELLLPSDTTVDVESAAHDVTTAARLSADGLAIKAREAATSALRVAGRPFLPGVHAVWVDQQQERLEGIRLRALEVVADAALAVGDWPTAQDAASQAVALAPLRESAYRRLALAHSGAGDRGEALRVLARCTTVLAEEVGADASPELEALSAALRTGAAVRGSAPPCVDPVREPAPVPARRSSGLAAIVTDRSSPFVNRTAELDALGAAWHRAVAGAPQIAVVAGEAGIGKTRLIAEFGATVPGGLVLYGRAAEAGQPGVEPVLEALRPHLSGTPVATETGLPEIVRTTLTRLTASGPVLLVLDDMQWIGKAGLAMLRSAVRDPLPVLVVAGFRTGEPDSIRRLTSLTVGLRRECDVVRIDLVGLARTEVAQLVRAYAGEQVEPDVVATIADATAGNPYFVHELLQLMSEQDTVGPHVSGRVAVPDGIREVILARCERLPARARRVLAAAAVCGREFDLAMLELLPDLSRVDVLAGLEDAVGSHLLVERPGRAGQFAFVHGLVQEALYQHLSSVRRQRLHADVASVLDGPHGGQASAPLLARHLLRGGPAVSERATIAAARAGAEALARHAYDEAAHDYAAALDVAGDDPAVRCRLRLELAGARWRAGETEAARAEFDTAAGEAGRAGRRDLAVRAVFGAVGHGPTLGRCDKQAVALLTGLVRGMRAGDPYAPRLLVRLAVELAGAGHNRAADLCREADHLAEAMADQSTVAYVLNSCNWANLNSVDHEGLRRADRIVALAGAVSDRHMLLEGRLWRCTYLLRSGELAGAEDEIAALEQVAIELRQPFYLRLPLRLRACLALARSQLDLAERYAAEAYTVERRVHPTDAEVHALIRAIALGHASRGWGNLGPRLVDALAAQPDAPHWRACRAVQLAYTGQTAPASRLLQPLLAGGAAALRASPLGAFALALVAQAIADHERLRRRIDVNAVHGALSPWRGSHVVAGCAVASLGAADAFLALVQPS